MIIKSFENVCMDKNIKNVSYENNGVRLSKNIHSAIYKKLCVDVERIIKQRYHSKFR